MAAALQPEHMLLEMAQLPLAQEELKRVRGPRVLLRKPVGPKLEQ